MLTQIFDEQPGQWGLRGDPYLWQELKEYLKQKKVPITEADFVAVLHKAFEELTGEPLTPSKEMFIQKFSHGGMSSGFISADFWLGKAFPMLMERFKQLKKS